jgi:hypothetical protein
MGGVWRGSGRNRRVRKGRRRKEKWFRKILYGEVKSGRMKNLRNVGKEGSGKGK